MYKDHGPGPKFESKLSTVSDGKSLVMGLRYWVGDLRPENRDGIIQGVPCD